MNYYELCAGTGAVGLALMGAPEFPVSRLGSKRGYADAIVERMLFERGALRGAWSSFTFYEADQRMAGLLGALLEDPAALLADVRALIGGDGPLRRSEERELWQRVRWVRSPAESLIWMAGARGGVGRWRGEHKLRPNAGGFSPSLDTLVERLAEFVAAARHLPPASVVAVDVLRVDPRDLAPGVVYFDPPYGKTGYAHKLAEDPSTIAYGWAAAGHHVFMSYDCARSGKRQNVEVSSWNISAQRRGQKRTHPTPEWLIEFAPT